MFRCEEIEEGLEGDGGDESLFRVGYDRARRLPVVGFLPFLSGGASSSLQTPHQGPCFIGVYRRRDSTVGRSDQAASLSLSSCLPSKDSSSGSSDDSMILSANRFIRRLVSACRNRDHFTSRSDRDRDGDRDGDTQLLLRAGERPTPQLTRFSK